MIRRFLTSCFLGLMLISLGSNAQPAPQAEKPVKVEQLTLKNGLTVILTENHEQPEVFGMVVAKAGGKDDPADATGMAHYMEHMLFKGTTGLGTKSWEEEKPYIDKIFALYDELGKTTDEAKRKEIQQQINQASVEAQKYAIPNEFSNVVKKMGGTGMNANTSMDRTVYFNTFPSNQMRKWLELYSHRFEKPVFRGFQAELEVVYEEKNLYLDKFQMQLFEEFNKYFFRNHPYGQQTLIGTVDDLKNPSLTKMKEFYDAWYVPNNMALIISGNFDTENVLPMIKETFGEWEKKEIPERKKFKEEPFDGRQVVEKSLSPIKLVMMGYYTAPAGHKDELALDVMAGVLTNSNQTGLLDELTLNNDVMQAAFFNRAWNDYGQGIVLIVPKIVGQSHEDAEQLVLEKIEKLKNGEFEDWMLNAIKKQKYRQWQMAMESNRSRGVRLGEAFSRGQSVEDFLTYPERILDITKEDVVEIANKYFTDKYLALFSKMGKPDKPKVEKPGYEPLQTNTNATSDFAEKLDNVPAAELELDFIDFDKAITQDKVSPGVKLFHNTYDKNDIYTFELRYGAGSRQIEKLDHAVFVMGMAGTAEKTARELKIEFAKLGATYRIFGNENYTRVRITGPKESFEEALGLINELLEAPKLQENALKKIVSGARADRKMEDSEPDILADALREYVLYGQESDYIDRLKMRKIKRLETQELEKAFKKATQYECEVHFVGNIPSGDVKAAVAQHITFPEGPKPSTSPVDREVKKYKENTVYFVDKKDALQSKVFFLANGAPFKHVQVPYINAFNSYFGGGFSGLVLQEIREYRSLAYGAGATYRPPSREGNPALFQGYVGTQADKTQQALDVFMELVREMPKKEERMKVFKPYLVNSAITQKPSARYLTIRIADWKKQGYTEDPMKQKIEAYRNLTFDDIYTFYQEHIQDVPVIIAIAGNEGRINMDALEQYGEIIEVKDKELFTD